MKRQPVINLDFVLLLICLVLLFWAYWLTRHPVHASTQVVLAEDFNSDWTQRWHLGQNQQLLQPQLPCWYQQQPTGWRLNQGQAVLHIDGPPCFLDLVPTAVDLRGAGSYQLRLRWTPLESLWMDRSLPFLWTDAQNWYNLKFFGQRITLEKVIAGQSWPIPDGQAEYPFAVNVPHLIELHVRPQAQISLLINQQPVLQVADQPPFLPLQRPHRIALRGSVGAVARSVTAVNDILLTRQVEASNITLNVPLWRQNDTKWQDDEYNHARQWTANPTIKRWGCALASMVMILRYHQITQLPDGQELTPQTLNQWLRQQPDGYIGGGVNWLAVTRLTQLLSREQRTPKLEFNRQNGPLTTILAQAVSELRQQRPVIVGYPGHFLVVDGVTQPELPPTPDRILIKDPYYPYHRLGQHRAAEEVYTIRRFRPSQTDLSYLLFVLPPQTTLTLHNSRGEAVPVEQYQEFITDPTFSEQDPPESERTPTTPPGALSPISYQAVVPQPVTDTYTARLRPAQPLAQPLPVEVQRYHYNQEGQVTSQKSTHILTDAGVELTVQFQKEVAAVPTPTAHPSSPSPSPVAANSNSPHPLQEWLRDQALLGQQLQFLQQLQRIHRLVTDAQEQWQSRSWQLLQSQFDRLGQWLPLR